jgi:hypothetical protein
MANTKTITVTLDRVKGSSFDSDSSQTSVNRGFIATGLPTNIPANTLIAAIQANLPQINSPHPTVQGVFVVGYSIKLDSDSVSSGYVKYKSQHLANGGKVNQWYFGLHSYLQSTETEIDPVWPAPDGGEQIHVSIGGGQGNGPIAIVDGKPIYATPVTQPGKLKYLRPIAVFSAQGTFTQPIPIAARSTLGCVNSRSYLGLAQGLWLVHDISEATHDGGNTYQCSIQMMSFRNESWASWLIATDFKGRPLNIPTATIKIERGNPYGIKPQHNPAGFSRYGLYNVANFQKTFNFPQQILNAFSF